MKIITILGARPQFIKAGSVSREIFQQRKLGAKIEEIIIHTGQHYDTNMSNIFFEEMQIPKPNYFLGIGDKTHGAMTGNMIEKIEEILIKEKPDWVMVYGDTNSTLAGAIAASKLHIRIAHVEAGLRSFNMRMPEEINRILTDRVSSILLCPTDAAIKNLKKEGFDDFNCKIIKSGDVMLDGAIFYKDLAVKPVFKIENNFVLCTIHRAENTDNNIRLQDIFEALNEMAKEKQIILPLHPRTKKIIKQLNINVDNLKIVDPVGYLEMVWLLDNCKLVITDSGGLQKEAYFFKKFCLTLRNETEWVELVEKGFNVLVGADKAKIIKAYKIAIDKKNFKDQKINMYGNGKASKEVINSLINYE